MGDPVLYPPPDFSCPPSNSFLPQQQPRHSGFQPGMWSWVETPTEPGPRLDPRGPPGWFHGASAGEVTRPGWGVHGHQHPYGQHFGHEWYQTGHQGWRNNHRSTGNYGKKQQQQRTKKEPEYSHFCDTCDRAFKNWEKYNEHIAQHVKCSVPDCSFMAHEKLVSIHWKNNHAPGTKRIKLDTAEEIAKWREERRKNYPTHQNVERKRQLMAEREKAGAVLDTAQFGRMTGRGRGRGRFQGRGHRSFQGRQPQCPRPSHSWAAGIRSPQAQPRQTSDPLGLLACNDHDSDREDQVSEPRADGLTVAPKQMSSALGSLMTNYGSMSESESDEEPQAIAIQRTAEPVPENQGFQNAYPPVSQEGQPARCPETSSQGAEALGDPGSPNNRRGRRGRGGRGGRGGRRRNQDSPQNSRPTLLEMLLAPDIRHERNILLQCVRYVVRNNFFGVGCSSPCRQDRNSMPADRGVQEDLAEEVRAAEPDAGSSAQGEMATNDEQMELTGSALATAEPKRDQGPLSNEPSCHPSMENGLRAAAGGFDRVAEETSDREDGVCATLAGEAASANVYNDEIWETPGAGMETQIHM